AAPPKTKASVRKAQSSYDTAITPPTAVGNDDASLGMNVGGEEGHDAEDDDEEVYRDVNINLEGRDSQGLHHNHSLSLPCSNLILTLDTLSCSPDPMRGWGEGVGGKVGRDVQCFKEEGQDEEDDEDELYRDVNINLEGRGVQMADVHTTQEFKGSHVTLTLFAGAVSLILGIVQRYMDQRINEAVKVANESDKIILDTYGDTVTLKRRRDDDADKDKEPSAGSDRGSKKRREGKEPESVSTPKEKATRSAGKSTQGSKSRQTSTSEFAIAEEPMQTTHDMEEPSHP
nr:hypothetical protein [Tanacetum cinerariifolium]